MTNLDYSFGGQQTGVTQLAQNAQQAGQPNQAIAPLPPTGIQQQVASVNQPPQQSGSIANRAVGNLQQQQQQQQGTGQPQQALQVGGFGSTNLNQLAKSLFQQYGLGVGRGSLVDQMGNIVASPKDMAKQTGMPVMDVVQKMSYISQSISDYQNRQAQQKGTSALQAGLGQVRSRGRGSLATLQSGFYQQMAATYTDANLLSQAQDFSPYVQEELQRQEHEFRMRELKAAKKGGGLFGLW